MLLLKVLYLCFERQDRAAPNLNEPSSAVMGGWNETNGELDVNTYQPEPNGKKGPTLEDLPNELLLKILGYCNRVKYPPGHKYKQTLPSLCRTNRLINRLATPLFYEECTLTKKQIIYCFLTEKKINYVRTLVVSPHLAAHVKMLKWDLDCDDIPISDEVVSTLEGYEYLVTLKQAINRGKFSVACLTAALMHTPNIESLCVEDITRSKNSTKEWLQPIIHSLSHPFQHLKSLNINSETCLDDMEHLLRLPSLQSLEVHRLRDYATGYSSLPQRVSKVEKLYISDAVLDRNLATIIESCEKLREFVCVQGHERYRGGFHADYPQIKSALNRHAPSLCTLEIPEWRWVKPKNGEWPEWNLSEKLDSFASYYKLAHLTLPAHVLIPINEELFAKQLPPNLKTLFLDGANSKYYSDSVVKALKSLLQCPPEMLRKLENISAHPSMLCIVGDIIDDLSKVHQGLKVPSS
jgi:hypothetical protein